jgi:hypothetical protein
MDGIQQSNQNGFEPTSQWLTYAEAGARFGISADAFRQIAMRRGWSRRRPKDDPVGRVQVQIPPDVEIRPRTDVARPANGSASGYPALEILVLYAALERERVRADFAESRAEASAARADAADADRRQAEARADAAIARADAAISDRRAAEVRAERLDHALTAERMRTGALQERIDVLVAEIGNARQMAETAWQAEEARQSRSLTTRLLAAWRGE